MSDDLVKRLRLMLEGDLRPSPLGQQAAGCIEALEARVAAADKLAEAVDDFGNLKSSDSSGEWGLRLARCLSELAAYQATKEQSK